MTPEKQIAALAKEFGWEPENIPITEDAGFLVWKIPTMDYCVPHPLDDLNVAHVCEQRLNNEQIIKYMPCLGEIVNAPSNFIYNYWWALTHATAPQRFEAILRTKGLWEEEN